MKKIKKGFFCTVEGIDGSGKSSIVNFLATELTKLNFSVIKTREPGGTSLGRTLRKIIIEQSVDEENIQLNSLTKKDDTTLDSKAEFLLFAADRAQHISSLIKPALEQGSVVISDRGSDSSLAYQGYGKGLDLEIISRLNSWIMENTKPDLVIYLKIGYQDAMDRVRSRGEMITSFEKKGEQFFHNVIEGFDKIVQIRAQESPHHIVVIDATQPLEIVQNNVLDAVLNKRAFKQSVYE